MSTRSRKIPLNVGVAGGGWNQKKKTGATISFHGEPNNRQFFFLGGLEPKQARPSASMASRIIHSFVRTCEIDIYFT
jgi:hypothetical protein